ncbi:hypothetical protein FOZ63_010149, partial [Perkinsus olseni]
MSCRLFVLPAVSTLAGRTGSKLVGQQASTQDLLKSTLRGWPVHLRESTWTFEDFSGENRILEDSPSPALTSLVSATVGVARQSGEVHPDYATLMMTEMFLTSDQEHQTATHYVYLEEIARQLPTPPSVTNDSAAIQSWATYFAKHPSERLARRIGPYQRIRGYLTEEPAVYAPLMVAYGLHNNAQDALVASHAALPSAGGCFKTTSLLSRYHIFTHSEHGKPCLRVDLVSTGGIQGFRIFSLYQDNEGTKAARLAPIDIAAINRVVARADAYTSETLGALQLQAYARAISLDQPQKAREFGL